MAAGSIKMDFAGTRFEAEEFAKANGLTVSKRTTGGEFPEVCARFKNEREVESAFEKLRKAYGEEFDHDHCVVTRYGR